MSIIHSMARKTLGGYLNASEYNPIHKDKIVAYSIEESLFTHTTHRMVARAINKVKQSGAEPCELNVMYYLEKHGIPRNIEEENELTAIMTEYAVTDKSFSDYYRELMLQRAKKVAI